MKVLKESSATEVELKRNGSWAPINSKSEHQTFLSFHIV